MLLKASGIVQLSGPFSRGTSIRQPSLYTVSQDMSGSRTQWLDLTLTTTMAMG